MFSLQNVPVPAVGLPGGLSLRPLPAHSGTAKYDLNLSMTETPEGLAGSFEHSTDLFDPATIERLAGHLRVLLEGIVEDPDLRLSALPLLTPDERDRIAAWSAAGHRWTVAGNLHERFAAQAARTPGALAVTMRGGESLTYRELADRASRLARHLRALGVGPESRVGLLAERSPALVVGILGVLEAGGAYLPLDPAHPDERLLYMLRDAGAGPVVVDPALAERATALDGAARLVLLGTDTDSHGLPPTRTEPEHPAYVIYTSGSTGRPKGVVVTHANVLRLFAATEGWFGFGPQDVWTLFHSYAFDFSVWEIWGALLHGGRLVVVPYLVSRSPEDFHRLLVEEGVTVLSQTPSAFRQLVHVEGSSRLALRSVVFGGEALDLPALAPWFERHGDREPRLVNMYGITETTVHVTYREIGQADTASPGSVIGRALPDLSVHLLGRHGAPVPVGVPGEIHVGGAGLARGYLGRPELTAERFVPDPFSGSNGARLYRSGDLARWRPDGDLEYLGRIDQQVKVRGFRIELGEIEAALAGHPGVREAAVLQGDDGRLTGYVVPREAPPRPADLRSHLEERLPDYMIPAGFVLLAALPLTANGKLDRRALLDQAPEAAAARGEDHAAPRTPAEELLAAVWQQVLGLDQVGIRDNFFALGGDSIRSIQVLSLAQERGLSLSVQDIFQHQTIADLAAALAAAAEEKAAGPEDGEPLWVLSDEERSRLPQDVEDAYPLTGLQAGMLFHMRLAPGEALYHNVNSWHLQGQLDLAALQDAVDRVVARHAVLRTSFDLSAPAEPLQRVHRTAALPVGGGDLRHLNPEQQEEAIADYVQRERRRPFDFAHPPQIRFHVHRRSDDSFQFTLTENHAIFDGWSLHSTLTEIFRDYTARLHGQPLPPEPPPAVAFRDFVMLERAARRAEETRAFWARQVAGAPFGGLPRWPVERERGGMGTGTGTVTRVLAPELVARLKAVAREAAVPFKSLLLAVHARVMAAASGEEDVVTGFVVNGRPESRGGEEVRGLFLNSVPLRPGLARARSWRELVRAAFAAEWEMLPHRRYPLIAIQDDAGGRPLFETAFNYIHFHVAEAISRPGGLAVLSSRRSEGNNLVLMVNFDQTATGAAGLVLGLDYHAAELARPQVETIAGMFLRASTALVEDPDADAFAASLLSDEEREPLAAWSAAGPSPPVFCLHDRFAARVAADPDAPAVTYEGETLSYGELSRRADRLAQVLCSWGIGPGELVGLCLERSAELVVAILGVLKTGAAYMPVDPDYPGERIARLLEDSGVPVLLTRTSLAERLPALSCRLLLLDRERPARDPVPLPRDPLRLPHDPLPLPHDPLPLPHDPLPLPHDPLPLPHDPVPLPHDPVRLPHDPAPLPHDPAPPPHDRERLPLDLPRARPEDPAYVIYTSGSTGTPKGVVVSHANVARLFAATDSWFGFGRGDVWTLFHSCAFDFSVWEIWGALLYGGRLVVVPYWVSRSPKAFYDLLRRERVTVLNQTPSAFRQLVWAEEEALGDREPDLALRTVIFGGEALDLASLAPWFARHGDRRPELVNMYGITETTIHVTYRLLRTEDVEAARGSVIGRAIPDLSLHVLDAAFHPAPIGVPGEICVGGAGLALGYLGMPERTAERFVPDPFGEPGARIYRSGDLARRLPRDFKGDLEYLGRIDHQVKIRGFRIELGEIETALARHPAVREAVVMVRTIGGDTGGEKQLVAYVVADPAPDLGELRSFLAADLPDYMLPSALVVLPELPLTAHGKVNRQALPEPERARPEHVAPRTGLERRIAEIWRGLLGVEAVGLHDSFFELGGNSLLMARLQSRVEEALGRQVEMVDLFSHPTVGSLARFLTQGEEALTPAPAPRERTGREIAIIGMAGRFPGAQDVEQLWQNLLDGVEAVSFFTDEELIAESSVSPALLAEPNYVRAGVVLEDPDLFDAAFFDLSPREAEILDPQHRLLLECAWQALERAGYAGTDRTVGVFAGASQSSYALNNLLPNPELVAAVGGFALNLASEKDFLASRLSYKLNLEGPSSTVQTACSTSLVALHFACRSLLDGDCELALAGGVSVRALQKIGYLYQQGGINSSDGHCRAFDARADGAIGGQGVGMVVLKRLEDALADGDHVHAVVKGTAVNNDGSLRAGFTAPRRDGQAKVILAAQERAQVDPEAIGYVETHGTATSLGDPIEVAALTKAFRQKTEKRGFCALGSIKTNIGHLDAAAGVAGLIKATLVVERGEIPPSLHFERPNPQIDFASSPFFVASQRCAWRPDGMPRRAGVSAFGMGGTNAHVILEEAPPAAPAGPSRPWQVLSFSARTPAALERMTDELSAHLTAHPEKDLADIAFTLRVGRRAFRHRRALVAATAAEAAEALAVRDPRRVWTTEQEPGGRPVAFLLPGVGDHYAGMAAGLYHAEPVFRQEIDRCAELLLPELGIDLRQILFAESETEGERKGLDLRAMLRPGAPAAGPLHQTRIAQPAVFAVGYALARLWMSWGVQPQALLGYSLGEYTAACLAGVLSLADALALVARRAQLIDELPPGAMLAVPLSEEETMRRLAPGLAIAAVNAPSVCVVSGPLEAVAALEERLEREGLLCRRIPTSHAFHSPMMEPAADAFRELLRTVELRAPEIPYPSNVTGTWARASEVTDPEYWVRHLCRTVRFADGVAELWREPGRVLLEAGPGPALGSLALQHPASAEASRPVALPSLRHEHDRQDDQAFLLKTLGQLWLAGVEMDPAALYQGERRLRVPLPTYPFERQRYWIERPAARPATERTTHSTGKIADPADWFHAPSWKLAVRPPVPGDRGGRWLVLEDGHQDSTGVGSRLVARLEAEGCDVIAVRAGAGFDYDALFAEIGLPARIVHLLSLTSEVREPDPELFDQAQETGFHSLLALAQALGKRRGSGDRCEICIVTNGLAGIERGDRIQPEKATLLGPLRVIPQEYGHLTCRLIDVDPSEDLIEEICVKGAEPIVARRGQQRWIAAIEPLPLDAGNSWPGPLRQGGIYLITGGFGGIGSALAEHLARTVQAKLVLVGRTPRPDLAGRLEELGAEAMLCTADVTDAQEMQRVVEEAIARWGRIDGVFHVAGLPGAGLLQLKTRDAAAEVLAVKARGALVLQSVLRGHSVDFLVLFSAMTSLTGGIGQVDYCAANAFLDVLAQSTQGNRQRGGVPTVSVNWCEWQWDSWTGQVGALNPRMQETLQRQRQAYGLTFAEGMEALGRALASGAPQVVVSTRQLQEVLQQQHSLAEMLTVLDRSAQPGGHGRRHTRPALPTPYAPPGDETERQLADLWGDLLGIEQIGIHDNFFLLGGHSLLGLQVMTRIDEAFQIELPLSVLFEAPTVAELAAVIAGSGEGGGGDGTPAARRTPEIRRVDPLSAQRMLESLDVLSEEEMDRLLAEMQEEEV